MYAKFIACVYSKDIAKVLGRITWFINNNSTEFNNFKVRLLAFSEPEVLVIYFFYFFISLGSLLCIFFLSIKKCINVCFWIGIYGAFFYISCKLLAVFVNPCTFCSVRKKKEDQHWLCKRVAHFQGRKVQGLRTQLL
jgi:hypothetical protein